MPIGVLCLAAAHLCGLVVAQVPLDPSQLGFGNKAKGRTKHSAPARAPRAITGRNKANLGSKAGKGVAKTAGLPQPYEVTFTFRDEDGNKLYRYPKLSYEWVTVLAGKKEKVTASGTVTPTADGSFVVAGTRAKASEPCYIEIDIPGMSDSDPEWEFVDPDASGYAINAAKSQPKKPVLISLAAPEIRLKRNLVDVILRGVPPGAKMTASDKPESTKLDSNGLCHFSVPREMAVANPFDIELRFEDDTVARQSVFNVADLIRGGKKPSPYKPLELTVPDESWALERVALTSLPFGSLAPSFGMAKSIGLYSEKQVLDLLGKPEKTEASSTFSKRDGAEWLHYPSKGVSFRVRELGGVGKAGERGVELVKLTGPAGGAVGGVKVADSAKTLWNRFGNGQTVQRLGKPRVGFHSFLSEGIVFNLDADSTKVDSIELWRPVSLLSEGFEPVAMALPNRVFVEEPGEAVIDASADDKGYLAKALAGFNKLMRDRVESSKSLRVAKSASEADVVLSWRFKNLKADLGQQTATGAAELEVSLRPTKGEPKATTVKASATFERSLVGKESLSNDLMRKLFEQVANPACDSLAGQFAFYNRVRSLDYTGGEVELDFGRDRCGLAEGVVFEVTNVATPAFPNPIPLSELKTPIKGKEIDKDSGARVVLLTKSVTGETGIAKFAVLFKQRGPANQGFVDRIVELNPEDWRPLMAKLLDPATGLLYVRLRPAFEMEGK